MKKWDHDELAHDLASHLRGQTDRVVWTDMQLGPSGSPRPDVYSIPKSYSKFRPLAYECKISTADYRRDVTAGKWQSYLKFASGVIFAVPAGLVKKEDVPHGCGLIVRHDEVWRTVKGPTLSVVGNLPLDTWIKLMIDGIERQAELNSYKPRDASGHWLAQKLRQKHGDIIANAFRDMTSAEYYLEQETKKIQRSTEELRVEERKRVEHARQHIMDELKDIRAAKRELAVALGLHEDSNVWQITGAANDLRRRLVGDGEIQRLRDRLKSALRALNEGVSEIPEMIAPPAAVAPTLIGSYELPSNEDL